MFLKDLNFRAKISSKNFKRLSLGAKIQTFQIAISIFAPKMAEIAHAKSDIDFWCQNSNISHLKINVDRSQ